MLFYCVILLILFVLFIAAFHYKKEEYIHLPLKEHPLKLIYGISLLVLDLFNLLILKNKVTARAIKQKEKLSKLYVGISPDILLRLQKAKIISFAFAIIFFSGILGVFFHLTNNSSNNSVFSLDRPTDGSEASTYELTAIIEGETTDIILEVESLSYSLEDAVAYFDSKRDKIEAELLNENISAYEITSDLNFVEKVDDISILWEAEDSNYIDFSGHILMENIPDDGVMTNLYATLKYKGHSANITIPVYIVKVVDLPSITDEIQSEIDEYNPYDESVTLPTNISGKDITYISKKTDNSFPFFLLG